MKHHLDHIAFRVIDLDRAIVFYTEKLGFDLVSRSLDVEHHEAFAFLAMAECRLELLQMLDEGNRPLNYQRPPVEPPYCPHLALQCEDLEVMVRDLHEKSLDIVKGPLTIPGEVKWLYIADPDNNMIEYVQWL